MSTNHENRSELTKKVKELLSKVLDIEEDEMQLDTLLFKELAIESAETLEITFRLEQEFSISIGEAEFWNIANLIATGKIDILINCAGYISRGFFLNTTEDVWKNTLDSNVNSIFHYSKYVLKHMILQKSGCIINISSVSAHFPAKGQAAYSTSKGAIESLTKALALEYGKYNIRVNTIAPGLIETEVVKTISPKVKSEILTKTPLGRFGRADDISNLALFLSSERASYITGTQILVTGGRHLE